MNEILKTLQNIRTIHGNFTDENISDENLNTILQTALRAPNAGNMQTYSIVCVTDRKVMRELFSYKGSVALVFCADHNRQVAAAEYLGYNFKPNTVGWFITASTDAVLAAQTASIAAQSLGIGSLFTTALYRGDYSRVKRILDLPDKYCFPIITLILGYPKSEPKYKKGRYSGKGLLHNGKYEKMNKAGLEEMIKQYDELDNHLGIPVLGHWEKHNNHLFDKIFSFWGRGGADESSKQLFEALKLSGYLDAEEL